MKNIFVIVLVFFSLSVISQNNRGYRVEVGDDIPDFDLNMLDGTTVNINDYKGKVVVLQFTASWCSVCRKEMPFLEKEVWQPNKNKDFVLIAVDLKESPEKVKRYIQKTRITYSVAIDSDGSVFNLFSYKNAGVTRNVVIDKNGQIAYLTRLFNREEFDEMKTVIDNLLLEK